MPVVVGTSTLTNGDYHAFRWTSGEGMIDPGTNPMSSVRILSRSSWMETKALDQLNRVVTLPGVILAVGLPDLHPGQTAPIGCAVVSRKLFYPHLAGNDIGCGMCLVRTNLSKNKPRLDRWEKGLRGLESPWSGDAVEWLSQHGAGNSRGSIAKARRPRTKGRS